MAIGSFPKVRLESERSAVVFELPPVPESLTVWGLLAVLSDMVRVPFRVPFPVGVNVTPIMQVLPTPTLVPQLSVGAKSPLTVILEIAKAPLPVLVRVTECVLLKVPRA
jgi:hypothetical protein